MYFWHFRYIVVDELVSELHLPIVCCNRLVDFVFDHGVLDRRVESVHLLFQVLLLGFDHFLLIFESLHLLGLCVLTLLQHFLFLSDLLLSGVYLLLEFVDLFILLFHLLLQLHVLGVLSLETGLVSPERLLQDLSLV